MKHLLATRRRAVHVIEGNMLVDILNKLKRIWGFGAIGDIQMEERDLIPFDRIRLTGAGQLSITQGDIPRLKIEAQSDILSHLSSVVEDGTLKLAFDGSVFTKIATQPIIYHLTCKTPQTIWLAGHTSLIADSMITDHLTIHMTGSSRVTIDALTADRLDITSAGKGRIDLSGSVDKQNLKVIGSGHINAAKLYTSETRATLGGLSDVTVAVENQLHVKIRGGTGKVNYYGDPVVEGGSSRMLRVTRLGTL